MMSFFPRLDFDSKPDAARRSGMTLTELLVVVSIIVILASLLVPMLQPVLKGQNTREASRQINVFLAGAQARAIERGAPVGVWFERAGHEPIQPADKWYTVYKLYTAEEPVPYTGDFYDSRVGNFLPVSGGTGEEWTATFGRLPDNSMCCSGAMTLVQPGDLIQFNYRGPLYPIILPVQMGSVGGSSELQVTFRVPGFNLMTPEQKLSHSPASYAGKPVSLPFTIFRQPQKATGAPIELPRNTGIDLSLSGYRSQDPNAPLPTLTRFREIPPDYDVVLMFAPDGSVARVYYIGHHPGEASEFTGEPVVTRAEVPLGTISLMVGRDDKIGRDQQQQPSLSMSPWLFEAGPLGEAMLADTTSMWLSISTHSGRVTSAPNAGMPVGFKGALGTTDVRTFLGHARKFADTGQSVGGR